MSFRTSITIVASPRPRVGKTLLARLLTDFHRQEKRAPAAFDLNSGEGRLADFLPEDTVRASIDDVRGQMALFDALVADDEAPKVVDLGAEAFSAFFTLAEQIGFAEEARARGIAPAVLYVLTPDATSVDAYRSLINRFPQILMAPVHNEIFGTVSHQAKYGLRKNDTLVRLPMLTPALRRYIEAPPFSFEEIATASAADIPFNAQIELQRWLRSVYLAFRELDLRILLTDLSSSIRLRL